MTEEYLNQTGFRCPKCGWALYDGVYSMNKACGCKESVKMTNREGHKLAEEFAEKQKSK